METTNLTFGQKLRDARKKAGLTQEQLAEKLLVSRQAVTKWESDKGMPDVDNWKMLSTVLNVSIDYLLDNNEEFDLTSIREPIDLKSSDGHRSLQGRWSKKAAKKDSVVAEKFKDSEIHTLFAKQILTKAEKITDNVLGFVFDAPFGIPQFLNDVKKIDKQFYLVNYSDKQYLVVVTDEFIESRLLSERITTKKFVIGNMQFVDHGVINKMV